MSAILSSLASRANSHLLKHYDADSAIVPVIEFPKSGGTWFAKMLAAYLDLPFIDRNIGPLVIPSVIRTHWEPHPGYSKAVYVVRDGRDTLVSLFHHRARSARNDRRVATYYKRSLGFDLDEEKIQEQFTSFLQLELDKGKFGSQVSWATHSSKAREICSHSNDSVLMKYEDIRSNPEKALCKTVEKLFEIEFDAARAAAVIELFKSGNNLKQRVNAEKTFFRSGRTGDWKSVVDADCASLINMHLGDELLASGYISSRDWQKEVAP